MKSNQAYTASTDKCRDARYSQSKKWTHMYRKCKVEESINKKLLGKDTLGGAGKGRGWGGGCEVAILSEMPLSPLSLVVYSERKEFAPFI